MKMRYTKWFKWIDRIQIEDINQPAVYYIANSKNNISGQDFSYLEDIIYIGMTISKKGLKGRLDQFDAAMKGKNNIHGGADRVKFKHKNAITFFNDTYIAACIFKLSNSRETPTDWNIKGDCVGHEYKSFAKYLKTFKRLPEFNDQKKSKKK
jgi:hypothetical protein